MADDDVLTVKEICDLLRVHPSTVYKLLRQGKLPSFRIGSEWRFRKDVILRLMAESPCSPLKAEKPSSQAGTGKTGGYRRPKG